MLREELRNFLRPEFLNRIDDVVLFRPLSKVDLRGIVDIQLRRLEKLLDDRELKLQLTEAAKDQLVELGYEPAFGARPLKRAILKKLQDPLAEEILARRLPAGQRRAGRPEAAKSSCSRKGAERCACTSSASAGTGMGALAALFREAGHEVTRLGRARSIPPMGPVLRALGVRCLEGYDAAHLEPAPDLVVVGNAIRTDNPEAVAAERARAAANVHVARAARALPRASDGRSSSRGTHGKTTTSAMCAWLLSARGLEPG